MGGGRGESPRDGKRHRNQTAPRGVMVKRRGKSPPARLKRRAHGKPTSEQGQIGNRRAARPAAFLGAPSGSGLTAQTNDRIEQNPAYSPRAASGDGLRRDKATMGNTPLTRERGI